MTRWRVEIVRDARTFLDKADKPIRRRIENFINCLTELPDPRSRGKALTGPYAGKWRYRVGAYRMICSIYDDVLVIEVVKIDHRSKVYQIR